MWDGVAPCEAPLPPNRSGSQSGSRRSRSALPITETELNVIAALATIGLRSSPKNGIQDPRRKGNPQRVVDEREEQVLPNVPHRAAAEPAGPGDPPEIALHQRHPRALHGHVGPGAHGDPDVRLGQRRRVVDAVPGHRHHAALGLEPLHDLALLRRQHLRLEGVEAEPARDRLGGRAAVAGQHDEADAVRPQHPDRLRGRRLHGVGHAERTGRPAVDRRRT